MDIGPANMLISPAKSEGLNRLHIEIQASSMKMVLMDEPRYFQEAMRTFSSGDAEVGE
jgi:hypothetical protein